MPDLKKRSVLPEKMDEPGVPVKEVNRALTELEIINQYLGGYGVTLNAFNKTILKNNSLTVMDVGCGGGDMLREIAKWGAEKKIKLNLVGVDWNSVMTEFAISKTRFFENIRYENLSIWDDKLLEEKPDIIINSLFCHHFDDEDLVKLIARMYELTNKMIIINDLHRHWMAYYSIKAITSVFSKTYLVKHDAPLSVERALTREEWQDIFQKAGIYEYQIKWKWAWRWQIIIKKI